MIRYLSAFLFECNGVQCKLELIKGRLNLMSLRDLEKFLNQDNKQGELAVDWDCEKQFWLDAVDKLYKDIVTWLEPLRENPNFKIRFEKIVLQEEEIGAYEVNRMIINLKGHKAILEPLGTIVIGSKGRIDLQGTNGSVKFTFVDKRLTRTKVTVNINTEKEHVEQGQNKHFESETPEYEWKIMTPAPNVQYLPLN